MWLPNLFVRKREGTERYAGLLLVQVEDVLFTFGSNPGKFGKRRKNKFVILYIF